MIISDKQREANRQNAQHSTGPKTTEGKAAIRFNALTYGLRTRSTPRGRKRRGLLPALGRVVSRLATSNPHRTVLPGNPGHLPMAAQAGCRERTENLPAHRIWRRTLQNVGVRGQATRATGALLPHRHRGHEAVAKGTPGQPAAARANQPQPPGAPACGSSPQPRRAKLTLGPAPRICDVGGRPGPPGLLRPRYPRHSLAICPPDL